MTPIALAGGVWMGLIYSAAVPPATYWIVQVAQARGYRTGRTAALAIALGQLPWCLVAALLLFQFPALWQSMDPVLRTGAAGFVLWTGWRSLRAPALKTLACEIPQIQRELFRRSFQRSLLMPWRLPLWAALIISVSIHWRGPGIIPALGFTLGACVGQLLWMLLFLVLTALFGHRVPEAVTIRSLNKLRLLALTVYLGLALIILAPLAFPPL